MFKNKEEGNMTREERFEIIAVSRKETLAPLAEEVRKSLEVKVIKQNTALVMMRVRDSVEEEIFNLDNNNLKSGKILL